jgi:hypothetical protein
MSSASTSQTGPPTYRGLNHREQTGGVLGGPTGRRGMDAVTRLEDVGVWGAGMKGDSVNEHLTHLMTGGSVHVPYMHVGHHRRDDPAASPEVTTLLAADGLPPHPYNGKPVVLVRLVDERLLIAATDRLAHTRECSRCVPIWERFDELLAGTPDGGMLSAGMGVTTSEGPAMLLVDAEDVPEEYGDEHEAAAAGGP